MRQPGKLFCVTTGASAFLHLKNPQWSKDPEPGKIHAWKTSRTGAENV